MWKHLWTGYPPPEDYVELVLCRDVYHCTPSQLDQEDAERVLRHLVCLSVEGAVLQKRR